MTTLHVANLPYSATEEEIRALFATAGDVQSVKLVSDRATGRPCGFCFVDMAAGAAAAAVAALNGAELKGRALRVNPAQEHTRLGGRPYRR